MLLTEIQRCILEAASSILQVYEEEQWVDIAKGETRFRFIAALMDEKPPIHLRAQCEFGFDAIYTGALVYGTVYDEEGEEVKPQMELEFKVEVPTDETKTIDMEKLQQATVGIIGKEPAIVHNERLAPYPSGQHHHQYTIEYFWTIGQDEDDFLNVEMYKDFFLELERLLNYLSPGAVYCITPTTEEIARAIAAQNEPATHGSQRCRVCGCTEITPCNTPEGPCFWVEPDLCSACAGGPAGGR